MSFKMSITDAFEFLYSKKPDEAALARARHLIGREYIEKISDLRLLIMGQDRQSYPTSMIVRFNEADLRYVNVENINFALDGADTSISGSIINGNSYEPHVTDVFRRYIKSGWRVVDIGANIGYFTMLAASIVGEHGEVLAFDPNSENCRLILINAARSNFNNIKLHPVALSGETGYAYFSSHIGSNGGMVSFHQDNLMNGMGLVVPTARLDDLIKRPVDFIKIDVEGAEHSVFRGALNVLSSYRPIVSSEFSCEMIRRVSGVNPREYLALFVSYGYVIYLIDRITGKLVSIGDIDVFLNSWGSPVRIEDFLMLPAGRELIQPE